jgi:hypothetical protein
MLLKIQTDGYINPLIYGTSALNRWIYSGPQDESTRDTVPHKCDAINLGQAVTV